MGGSREILVTSLEVFTQEVMPSDSQNLIELNYPLNFRREKKLDMQKITDPQTIIILLY